MQFKSFQSRLIVFFTLLLALVLSSTFVVVNQKNIRNAEDTILNDLAITANAFSELRKSRIESLYELVGSTTRDFAFLGAIGTRDNKTIIDAMNNNIIDRIFSLQTSLVILLNEKGDLIASTNEQIKKNYWPWLVTQAQSDEYGEADGIVQLNQVATQLVILPINARGIEAWIMVGFPIEEVLIAETKNITRQDVSVLAYDQEEFAIWSSSLDNSFLEDLKVHVQANTLSSKSQIIQLNNERFVSVNKVLEENPVANISILMQGSLDKALLPYERLNQALLLVFLVSLFSALLAVYWLSRSISKPLEHLSQSVKLIDKGDYSQRVSFVRQDEIGKLAESVNNMAQGLAEKEQVRNLLGKVVSDEIATELLSKKVELGGEEKIVSVLFSDVRNFTAMCEGAAPTEILTRLNRYFNKISLAIENHSGVVDKYIGDAIMALYGAPVSYSDCSDKAIASALEMIKALDELNIEFANEGISALEIGIGINSGEVVVGNMGSEQRMNYTVIGDNVNLASRLEGLTKHYGCAILLSEGTKKLSTLYTMREVDKVKVKGKQEAVTIYEPVCLVSELTENLAFELEQHAQALDLYRKKNWKQAKEKFSQLGTQHPDVKLYHYYKERCESLIDSPPSGSWQAVTKLNTK